MIDRISELILGLLAVPGMGKKTVVSYIEEYGLTDETQPTEIIENIARLAQRNKRIQVLDTDGFNSYLNRAETILRMCEVQGVVTLNILEDDYPEKLRRIKNPPVLLYMKGDKELLSGNRHIAIIGTREPTEHGKKVGFRLGQIMAEKGNVIVSGLAIGCDTCGHEGCLDVGGRTIAILPSPLDDILPKSNRVLAKRILGAGGLLLSEYPPGESVQAGFYIERDRLQAGLSDGVIVIETGIKGGTMHTVGFCKDYKRILACYKHSEAYADTLRVQGNRKLISDGDAIPIGSDEEITAFLETVRKNVNKVNEAQEEQIAFDL